MARKPPANETHRFFDLPPWLWEAPHAAAQTFLVVREAVRRVLFEETLAMHAAAIAFWGLLFVRPRDPGHPVFGRHESFPVTRIFRTCFATTWRLVFPSARDELLDQVTGFGAPSKVYGLLGLAGLLWSGSRVFASLDICLNEIWRVRKTRPYWRHRLLSIGLVPLLLLLFIGLLSATSLQNLIEGTAVLTDNGPIASPLLSDFTRYGGAPAALVGGAVRPVLASAGAENTRALGPDRLRRGGPALAGGAPGLRHLPA